jgi:hypothetical protein
MSTDSFGGSQVTIPEYLPYITGFFDQHCHPFIKKDTLGYSLATLMTRALKDLFNAGAALSIAYHKSREEQEVDIEGFTAKKYAWAVERQKLRDQIDKLGVSLDNLSDHKLVLEHKMNALTSKKEALLKENEDLYREKILVEKSERHLELELQIEKGKRMDYCQKYFHRFVGSQAFNPAASAYMSNVVIDKSKRQLELELHTEKGKRMDYCQEYLQRFLGSKAFHPAASAYMSNVVQHVYLAVTALSRYYPFVPEEAGFKNVKLKGLDLSKHYWEEDELEQKDALVSPDGEVL